MRFSFLKIYICVLVIITGCFFVSCTKTIEYEGPTGTLKGRVKISDCDGNFINDLSGVKVTVDGSSPVLTATTNEKGEYSIEGLKTGIYDISIFKDSTYSTYKVVSYQFIGSASPCYLETYSIQKLPLVTIHNFYVYKEPYSNDIFKFIIHADVDYWDGNYNNLRYYINDSSNVSYQNYLVSNAFGGYDALSFETTFISSDFPILPKGKRLYIIAYPYASRTGYYVDIKTGRRIYCVQTNAQSQVDSFIIPK